MNCFTVYIDSAAWVCETNLIGCSRLYRYMVKNGHEIVDDPSKADYIIINSCGLTRGHITKCINMHKKYISLKRENAKIILYGCLVKIDPKLVGTLDVLAIDFNEDGRFDEIFYNKIEFKDIKPYCDIKTRRGLLLGKNPFYRTKIFPFLFSSIILPFSKKARLNYKRFVNSVSYENKIFLEISKGCTGNCNYCVIKRARGKICSRTIKDVISDTKKIVDPSKKLYLVANDCGCYGVDIKTNLIDLLYEIDNEFPDLAIDLNYLNPQWLERYSDEYVKLFKDVNIDFVVIPMQSGSNSVLKDMNRRYDINKVVKVVDRIKKASSKTFIYSHFIVGHPGEKWSDFIKTLISATHFDFPIAFGYSEHEGTVSSSLPHHKSNFTIMLRYLLFVTFMNFFLLYKIISSREKI